jgi:hypothetical protein
MRCHGFYLLCSDHPMFSGGPCAQWFVLTGYVRRVAVASYAPVCRCLLAVLSPYRLLAPRALCTVCGSPHRAPWRCAWKRFRAGAVACRFGSLGRVWSASLTCCDVACGLDLARLGVVPRHTSLTLPMALRCHQNCASHDDGLMHPDVMISGDI